MNLKALDVGLFQDKDLICTSGGHFLGHPYEKYLKQIIVTKETNR